MTQPTTPPTHPLEIPHPPNSPPSPTFYRKLQPHPPTHPPAPATNRLKSPSPPTRYSRPGTPDSRLPLSLENPLRPPLPPRRDHGVLMTLTTLRGVRAGRAGLFMSGRVRRRGRLRGRNGSDRIGSNQAGSQVSHPPPSSNPSLPPSCTGTTPTNHHHHHHHPHIHRPPPPPPNRAEFPTFLSLHAPRAPRMCARTNLAGPSTATTTTTTTRQPRSVGAAWRGVARGVGRM